MSVKEKGEHKLQKITILEVQAYNVVFVEQEKQTQGSFSYIFGYYEYMEIAVIIGRLPGI